MYIYIYIEYSSLHANNMTSSLAPTRADRLINDNAMIQHIDDNDCAQSCSESARIALVGVMVETGNALFTLHSPVGSHLP